MDLNLKGRRALVTASSGGIGEAIAKMLAEEGVRVVVNGRSEATVSEAVARIRRDIPEAGLDTLVADLGTAGGCQYALQAYPSIDILVNNLGVYEQTDFFELSDESWLHLFEVNVLSGIRLARHYLKDMIQRDDGRIIFISSECAINPDPSMAHYSSTKTMQMAVSRNLAELTKGGRVTVNSVLPGPVATPGAVEFIGGQFPELSPQAAQRRYMAENRSTSIIQRLSHSDEIASVVAFLSSEKSSSINGAAVRVDGGLIRSVF